MRKHAWLRLADKIAAKSRAGATWLHLAADRFPSDGDALIGRCALC